MAYLGNYPAETQTVDLKWQSVKTANFTAEAGKGYWINTTSSAVTVTLPASANAGDTIELVDYARTWGTNAVTINQNSLNFQSYTSPNPEYNTNGQSVRLVYSGASQGWIPTVDDDVTFETPQPIAVDFLVIAGGGSGASNGGGGGAGGYRNSYSTESSGGGGSSETNLALTPGEVYTVTVGAGAPGGAYQHIGQDGSNSLISGTGITTITSIGGGGGGSETVGRNGGSGGGGGYNTEAGGSGTANQGRDGSASATGGLNYGGGGGANTAGANPSGNGGDGLASSITGSSVTRAGGGGGGRQAVGTPGSGGAGGGANGGEKDVTNGGNATVNTGSGGGGSGGGNNSCGNGASGVVILRIPTADYTGTTSGSPTVSTSGSDTILIYNASGSYTA